MNSEIGGSNDSGNEGVKTETVNDASEKESKRFEVEDSKETESETEESSKETFRAEDLEKDKSNETEKPLWDSWDNYEKVYQNGQEYAKVGDRLYSQHAVERMQPSGDRYNSGGRFTYNGTEGRSVAPQYVEDAIKTSKPEVQENGNISHKSGSLNVITNKDGAVVTIVHKKKGEY